VTSLLAALTVKVSAILLLALVATQCLRTRSAAARHWVLAVGVVSACFAPAVHLLPLPPVQVVAIGPLARSAGSVLDALGLRRFVTQPADAPAYVTAAAAETARYASGRSRSAVSAVDAVVGRWAVAIWLVGAGASTGVLLVGLARLRWLRVSSRRVTDGPWHRLCAELARSCGLRRGVDLLLGPRPGLVATWGWRRPAVMLPASASAWSAERMRVVLLHELAHARRGDWMLQMAVEALRCAWWFNPLAWVVRARLRRDSEQAADDLVLARGVPATTCAMHLVELAKEARRHRRTWLPAPAMARPSHLERRLSAMLNSHTNRRPMTRFARTASLGALVLASILVAGLQVAAQDTRINGQVLDQAGNAVRNPDVSVILAATGQSDLPRLEFLDQDGNVVQRPDVARFSRRASVSGRLIGSDDGSFGIQGLEPGEYSLTVTAPGFEPLSRRFSVAAGEQRDEELVLSRIGGSRQPRAGSEPASRVLESIGRAVEQEPAAAPSSERIEELVERASALQAQLQAVLDELQTVLDDSDRAADGSNEPIRVGGGVPPPAKIHDVPPVYPPAAQTARIQGVVVMEATISPTGEVGDIEVLRSVPELDAAAISAVEQWRYEPTLVDGVAVPVLMTLTINFSLR
jgi:TonB family protein